ncbi:MAG: hypothetical protein LH468_12545 [Nocardioides sp.]|nr:hypothetical protein [Nocardioides sp.]
MEYRQSFRAAARILGPALVAGDDAEAHERVLAARDRAEQDTDDTGLRVEGLVVDGVPYPDLVAAPGERVAVSSRDPHRVEAVLAALCGTREHTGTVMLAGRLTSDVPSAVRRTLVGSAARGWALERGTVERSVRYRDPASTTPVEETLRHVGLDVVLSDLPEGARTRLRRGGEPLSLSQRGRVLLARAVHGSPPLVVLDHLDGQLDPGGRRVMSAVIAAQRGVVVLAGDDLATLVPGHRCWDLDALAAHPPGGLVRT